jgi:hypothetical protein
LNIMERGLIERVKDCFTIEDAWHALSLDGRPAKSCRCPWRDDRRPSFSIFAEGRRWFDHSSGEGGDVVDFVKAAVDLPTADAVRWCAERSGLGNGEALTVKPVMRATTRRPEPERKPEPWPNLRPGTAAEKKALANLRGFTLEGIELAARRGLLHFGIYDAPCQWRQHWRGLPFWAVADDARRLVELRLLSGEYWPERDGSPPRRKAHSIGNGKDHPCGIELAAGFPVVAVVEGAPDLVAAHDAALQLDAAERVAVCSVLGAGVHRLAVECLPCFRAKHVRIYPHTDESGMSAARQWAAQIKEAGAAVVDAFDLSGFTTKAGKPGKDLADLLNADPRCLRANPELLNDLFP